MTRIGMLRFTRYPPEEIDDFDVTLFRIYWSMYFLPSLVYTNEYFNMKRFDKKLLQK